MKNRLNTLWNVAPRNPTQTAYTRFLRNPSEPLKTAFSIAQESFDKEMADRLKTSYSDLLDDTGGGDD